MATTIKNLEFIIEKRAKEKLDTDIIKFLELINNNELYSAIEGQFVKLPNSDKTQTLREFLWNNNTAFNLIKERYLPIYIEREAKQFTKSIDEMDAQMNELRAELDNFKNQ